MTTAERLRICSEDLRFDEGMRKVFLQAADELAECRDHLAKRTDHAADGWGEVVKLRIELETLRATAARRLGLLRKCEWAWGGRVIEMCPCCGNPEKLGHKPDCPLAAELKESK